MINEPERHPTNEPPTKPGPMGKPTVGPTTPSGGSRANAPDQESPTSTTEKQWTLDELRMTSEDHVRMFVDRWGIQKNKRLIADLVDLVERCSTPAQFEAELAEVEVQEFNELAGRLASAVANLSQLLMIERDETARLKHELSQRDHAFEQHLILAKQRDEELAAHEAGLYAKELELKVECPNEKCAASFVGEKAAESLVRHVLNMHVDVTHPRRWTDKDAYNTPEPADRPKFMQGFNEYQDGHARSNGVVFQYVVGGASPRWRAMTETEGDGDLYSWSSLLSENSSDAFSFMQEVPDPREKHHKAD